MTIFSELGFRERGLPLANVQYFAMEQLVSVHATTTDLRWAMVELMLRSFSAVCVLARAQLTLLACRVRHGKRCLAERLDAADTMVAAGGR